MLKKIKKENSYEYGKKIIFLITFGFSFLGFIVNLLVFYQFTTFWLKLNTYVTLFLLVVALILYLRNQTNIRFYYGLLTWFVIINIFIGQILFPDTPFYLNVFESLVLRNLIFVMSVISIAGFISSQAILITQVTVLFVFLFYYAFIDSTRTPFLALNIYTISVVTLGYVTAMLFFIRHLRTLIFKVNQQQISLKDKNDELFKTLENAKVIQDYMLPNQEKISKCFTNYFICFEPKDLVSGDFYWVEKIGNKKMFAVADCTGHGVSGAITSMTCHQALTRSVKELKLTSTGEILDSTRNFILEKFNHQVHQLYDGMDIALCCIENDKLTYSGANIPLWIYRKGRLIEYAPNKQPIGSYVTNYKYDTQTITLEEGDRIYLSSDGFSDQFGGERGKKMKSKVFRETIENMQSKKMINQGTYLINTFRKWRGDIEQIDDVCVLGISVEYDK